MLNSLFLLAQAAAETAAPAAEGAQNAPQPDGLMKLLGNPMVMVVLFIVIFWVLIIRPQRKAQKEHQEKLSQMKVGDQVVTNAGIHGRIENISDRTVSLKIADGVTIKIEKPAIVHINPRD